MAVEKMKYISLMGKISDMDDAIRRYVTRYAIQLESACETLGNRADVEHYMETDPYYEEMKIGEGYLKEKETPFENAMHPEEAADFIRTLDAAAKTLQNEKMRLEGELTKAKKQLHMLEFFMDVDTNLFELLNMEFVHSKYGKMPEENIQKAEELKNEKDRYFFVPIRRDMEFTWGFYFAPRSEAKKADMLFAALQFMEYQPEIEITGTPKEAYANIENALQNLTEELQKTEEKEAELLSSSQEKLSAAYHALHFLDTTYRIRQNAAYIKDEFYILVGWMTAKDAKKLEKEIEHDKKVIFSEEDTATADAVRQKKPPTKLKNFFFFRHFEMFVRMYGLPSQKEIDPTPFLAITYAFLFGMMFGDFGQGLVLLVGGLLIYKIKKMDLAAIIAFCGIFSTFFGYMYGSCFGFEDSIIKTHWISPMHGGTMQILLYSVGLGAAIIFITMIFNIINCIRNRKIGKLLFDTNGIAGIVFYTLTALLAAPLVAGMFGMPMGSIIKTDLTVIGILIAVCLLFIWFREPLGKWISREKGEAHASKGMFLLESFFELFEVLLSYVTNSISFVRVGAFALSHAGMMSVVHMLAGVTEGVMPSLSFKTILVMVLGNLLVMGMEGLVVGIQVLRLEFYEIFSRFYSGEGEEFCPNTLERESQKNQ